MATLFPIDSPSVWVPRDIPDESSWSFELTDRQRRALIDFGRGGDREELTRLIGRDCARWAGILVDGRGFLRLRRFPVDLLTVPECERAYLGLGGLLGKPVGQDRAGSLFTHIRDERLRGPSVRRYQTNLTQGFHTDASDLVGLLCLQPAKTGGRSRIVSAHALYNEILRIHPHLIDVLHRPMPWSRHVEKRPGEVPYFELAPISVIDGLPRIFLIPWFIRQSQEHDSAPRLTEDQLTALDVVEKIANDPEFQIEMEFQPGDVQLLDNTTVLHAREGYTDHDDPALRRHLLRLWLTIDSTRADDVLRGGLATSPRASAQRSDEHCAGLATISGIDDQTTDTSTAGGVPP